MTFHPVVKDAGVLCGSVQLRDSGASRETLFSLHWSCVSKGQNMFLLSGLLCGVVLKRACCFDFRSQGIGSVVEYVLTHVEDMLPGGYSGVR